MQWSVLMMRPPPQAMEVVDHLWGHQAPVAPECMLEEWRGDVARETVPGQAPCQTQLEVVVEASQQG
jgi:hypothetical protein